MKEEAISTSPLNKKDTDGKITHVLKRKFLGNLFPINTFESNELKAYCKGHSMFTFGRDEFNNPTRHVVKQEYYYEPIKA